MARMNLKDIGMDTLEILYYERKEARQKAYAAKRRKKSIIKKGLSIKEPWMEKNSGTFDSAMKKAM